MKKLLILSLFVLSIQGHAKKTEEEKNEKYCQKIDKLEYQNGVEGEKRKLTELKSSRGFGVLGTGLDSGAAKSALESYLKRQDCKKAYSTIKRALKKSQREYKKRK